LWGEADVDPKLLCAGTPARLPVVDELKQQSLGLAISVGEQP